MAYSINATYVPATLMEQVLIQHKIPFDLLFDEQLKNLDRYGAVILAGQECVANAQVQLLLDYVRRGGTLVITGNTGEFNEWREKRHKNPFLPARSEGSGRIVYIPEIRPGDLKSQKGAAAAEDAEPGAAGQHTPRMSPPQWVLPKNHEEIFDAVAGGLSRGLSLKTDAPLTTTAELLTRPESHETIVHFVNFDREHPLSAFHASVRKQFGDVKSVMLFSPDEDDPIRLNFESEGDLVNFTVPAMRVYSMIVMLEK